MIGDDAMDFERLTNGVKDVMTVRQVYGDPYEKDGVTIIPVASVYGGGGGGDGTHHGSNESEQVGSGAGLGFRARPAGVYVIKGDHVTWRPALNVNRVIAGGQAVAVTAIIALRKARQRRLG